MRLATLLRRAMACLALGLLLLASAGPSWAAEPPPGMSRDQFDALVAAVAETLARNIPASGPHDAAPPAAPAEDSLDVVTERVSELAHRLPDVLGAVPGLPGQSLRVLGRLDATAMGGPSAGAFLARLALVAAAAIAAGWLVARLLAPLKRSLVEGTWDVVPLGRGILAAALDGAAVAAVWLTTRLALGTLLAGSHSQSAFAASVLDVVVFGACAAGVMTVWLRPALPTARLAPVDNRSAARLRRWLVGTVALVALTRVFLGLLATPAMISAALLVNAVLVSGAYAALVLRCREAFGQWLAGLVRPTPGPDLVRRAALAFQRIALPCVGVIALLRLYAALSGRASVPLGTIATMSVLLVLLLGETLFRWILRHPDIRQSEGSAGIGWVRACARLGRAVLLAVCLIVLARVWIVDALGILALEDWAGWNRALWQAALCVLAGLALWEGIRITTDPYMARAGAMPTDAEDAGPQTGSRLRTLAPLLRMAALALIVTLTLLAVLAFLGVNITPLIAGASILGLAISFGSQTLVRDIVSGVFYLAEDAFRVGEYIDAGRAKGTVEGFALRSIKLRHQNGQLHTIPFGQLGQVTNFSRDWSTVKFNLRFARDTDVEALRKAAKRIGQHMLEDPEYASDFLEPLKMQGVVDILDEALVARFKFTVRPVRPSLIQRESIKRLLRELPACGIRFPQPIISVLARGADDVAPAPSAPAQAASAPSAGTG